MRGFQPHHEIPNGLYAVNDGLIDRFVADPANRVDPDGTIWTTRLAKGTGCGPWRRADSNSYRSDAAGYRGVRYKRQKLAAHRIVYRALVGPLDPNKVINHIDGNPANNHPTNLELVTQGENNTHRFRVMKRPAVIGNARLTREQVGEIRSALAGGARGKDLAAQYRVSEGTISEIRKGRIWKDVS